MKDKDQHILEQNAPVLFSIKKENNLEVPKGYLKQMPKDLLKISEQNTKTVSINKNWYYVISIAAVLIVGLFIIRPNQTTINNNVIAYNESFNNLTAEDFEAIILDDENDYLANSVDFNDAEELQLFASELQKPLQPIAITEQDFENYFESEIEEYYY